MPTKLNAASPARDVNTKKIPNMKAFVIRGLKLNQVSTYECVDKERRPPHVSYSVFFTFMYVIIFVRHVIQVTS